MPDKPERDGPMDQVEPQHPYTSGVGIPAGLLVFSGILNFALYLVMDAVATRRYEGYSYRDHTISELSAIGSPTRRLWLLLSLPYQALAFAFAFGVLRAAGPRPRVRIVGRLLFALAAVGLLWWVAPMHRREVLARGGGTWQDTLHLVVGGLSSALFASSMVAGAFAFGRLFRVVSLATLSVVALFGGLMSTQTSRVGRNEPTPWLGIRERIAVEGSMLWQALFAAALLGCRRESLNPSRDP